MSDPATIEPIADLLQWLNERPEPWYAAAHQSTLDYWNGCNEQARASIRGLVARAGDRRAIGFITFSDLPGDPFGPYLIYVQAPEAVAPRGTGFHLFRAMREIVEARPIAAFPSGEDGERALPRWGFRALGNGWWEYSDA